MIRLNKYIADSGYCSRREADTCIEQGRVTVNGRQAVIGYMVQPNDRVLVDGELIKGGTDAKKRIYIALNKPVGVTSTTDLKDPTNIVNYINHPERIFPIGRLDKDSQGLILLTNDGDIVNKILRAGNAHQKEYIVTVHKPITSEFVKRMSAGMKLEDGAITLPCKVVRETDKSFRIFLIQGLNRQIRRMCMMLGYNVEKLERIRIMNITLKGIRTGGSRELTDDEVKTIMKMVESSDNGEQASKARIAKRKAEKSKPRGEAPKQRSEATKQRSEAPKSRSETSRPRSEATKPRGERPKQKGETSQPKFEKRKSGHSNSNPRRKR